MTSVMKHALRVGAGMYGSFRPEGWNPKLRVTLLGPSPEAELVAQWRKPDGSDWVEHRTDVPELGEGELKTVDLSRWQEGDDIDVAGDCAFTLRLENELDGIDEVLHEGVAKIVALDDEHRYVADFDQFVEFGLVFLDVADDSDGPKLRAHAFFKGEAETYEMEAHLFQDGKRVKQANYLTAFSDFTSNEGSAQGREIVAEFDDVRGWNNLSDEGWGSDDWLLLDRNPGSYEIKFTRGGKKIARTLPFAVGADGRIVKSGRLELNHAGNPVIWVQAAVSGELDGAYESGGAVGYGDLEHAAIDWPIESMYALRKEAEVVVPDPYDEATMQSLEELRESGENLLRSWESDLAADPASRSHDYLLQLEYALIPGVDRWEERVDAELQAVPWEHELEVLGDTLSMREFASRVLTMRDTARSHMGAADQAVEDELAPYRELLSNDKLAIFEDHPANGFLYYTTDKRVIESAEELYDADYWYFEGSLETQGTATVDGSEIKVSVQGWRVLGYKFDADGNTVQEYEEQGTGPSAPKSAFNHA